MTSRDARPLPASAQTYGEEVARGSTVRFALENHSHGTVDPLVVSVVGTAHKITVTANPDGSVTLTLPASIQLDGTTAATLLGVDVNKRTVSLGAATNGQIPIGSTGNLPTLAAPTAGVGVTITAGAGSLDIKLKQQAAEGDAAAISAISAATGTDSIDRTAFNTSLGTMVSEINALKSTVNNLLAKLRTAEIIAT